MPWYSAEGKCAWNVTSMLFMSYWWAQKIPVLSDTLINKHEWTVRKVHSIVFFFSEFKDDRETVSDVILTLTALIVRNEFCEKVEEAGGIMFIMDVFVNYPASEVKGSLIYI